MRRIIIAVLLSLNGVAGALAQPAPAKQNLPQRAAPKPVVPKQAVPKQVPATQNGKCLGVVSQLGENFTVKKIGLTVFGNEQNEVAVGPWRIDDLVVAKISAALGKQAAVQRIPYQKAAFASLDTPKLFRNYEAEFAEAVRAVAAGTRCARYVVVARTQATVGNTNQSIEGIRILYRGVDLLNTVHVHAFFSLRLYDGETFTLLKQKAAPSEFNLFADIRGPHRQVDKSFWPSSPDRAVQDAKLREVVRELVDQGMEGILAELQLTE
jgi:hypothetical protein